MPGENVAAGVTFQLMCSCCRARGKGHGGACMCVCVLLLSRGRWLQVQGKIGGSRAWVQVTRRLDRAELRWMIVALLRISLR